MGADPRALLTDQAVSWVDVQTMNGPVAATVSPIVAVRETVGPNVAIRFDFPHHVIPNVGSADTPAIQLLRELAVHFVPGPADAGTKVALQRVDQVGEFLRVPPVLAAS